MLLQATSTNRAEGVWQVLAALADADGSAAHPAVAALLVPTAAKRDLADAIHAICTIHGRYLFDDVALAEAESAAGWFATVARAFTTERTYLAHLTAAAGPLPSTPGQAAADAAFASQRHAFDMLAASSRKGCAVGAALALILDWHVIRDVLDAAAERFGVTVPPRALPGIGEIAAFTDSIADTAATQRAIAFGAQQVFAQHRGLWSLLEARASARGDA
jgi:hypothetical protein